MSNKNLINYLPSRFLEKLSDFCLPSELNQIVKWLQIKRKVNIRINTLKSDESEVLSILRKKKIKYKKFELIENSYILENSTEREIKKLDIYDEGKLYFQNIASQIPVSFLWVKPWEKVLDVTAAPGSKTSQICSYMQNKWEIYANEIDKIRFERLAYNIDKLWCRIVKTINSDARKLGDKFEKESFDRVLADLPCSAEGRIHLKSPKSFWYWSEKNIVKHAKLQKQILSEVIPLIKKGWIMIYSTCTIAPEENEEITNWILENFSMKVVPIDMEYKFIKKWIMEFEWKKYHKTCKNTIRSLPWDISEGFYIAKFKKI